MEPRGCERHRWATRTGELSGESESMEPRGCERHRWATRTGELSGESESILLLAAIGERWHRKSICSKEHKTVYDRACPACFSSLRNRAVVSLRSSRLAATSRTNASHSSVGNLVFGSKSLLSRKTKHAASAVRLFPSTNS